MGSLISGLHIPRNRRPNPKYQGQIQRNRNITYREMDHGRTQDIPSTEHCRFKSLSNTLRAGQTEVHESKKLNFVRFISLEMQIGVQKKVSHFIEACS